MRTLLATMIILLGACSHIPDPADIPQVEPFEILQNIRCEVRDVVLSEYPKHKWLHDSDIAYGLTLKAEENKTKAANLTFIWPIHLGTFTLGLDAGAVKLRSGEGKINIAEPVGKTLSHRCLHEEPPHTRTFPILGTVGLRDVIRRFVDLNTIARTKPEDFSHTLKFHLTLNAGAKPSFSIAEVSGRKLSGFLDLHGDRKDQHELIIKMSPPALPAKAPDTIKIEIVKWPESSRRTDDPPEKITIQREEKLETPSEARQRNQERLLRSIEREQERQRLREDLREELRLRP